MSAPSSSVPRGTGSISSQPVTASVIKFRCLYTHDLRRKSKRWQDGYLRYHAFNKRIMVYDEQGNYIGDHHWRSGEEVQDGDELELDKGALIQVGERMGTTQQDLSNLFEKRKSSQGSPQANDRASQTPGISTPVQPSGSSQPFRSLNDLLGIKKTPIGHLVSPYEERHPPPPPSASESPNRPPKRQKVPLAERSSVDRRQAPAQVVDLTESAKLPSVTNARNIASARETQRLPKDFHSSPHAPPKNKQIEVSKTTQPSSDPAPFVKPTLPPSASSKRPPDSAPHTHARGSQKQGVETNGRPNNTVPPPSRPSSRKPSAEVPTGTLRMSTEKPRRKLMYSALLPNETSQKSSPTPTMPPPDKRSQSTPRAVDQLAVTPALEIESTNAEFMPSDSTQFILEEMTDTPTLESTTNRRPNPPAPQNFPIKRALDAPLRKSLSDPTALTGRPALHTRPTLMRSAMSAVPEEPQVIEEGPWTSEALDLFDFWPPGRPKPC